MKKYMEQHIVIHAIILNYSGKILLVKRSSDRAIFPNLWSIVGGHIEEEESPKECLVREIFEELWIREFYLKKEIPEYTEIIAGNKWRVNLFIIEIGTTEIILNYEASEYRWIEFSELQKFLTTPKILKHFERAGY